MQELAPWALATIGVKWLVYASALLAAGGACFLVSQPALAPIVRRSTARLAVGAALVSAVVTLVRLGVQAGRLIDEGWRGMLDAEMLALAAGGPLGDSTLVRLVGLTLLLALALPVCRRDGPWLGVPLGGAVLVAASFAFTGHASGEPRAALAALLGVHLLAASFWVGALWPLARLAADTAGPAEAARAAERFGRQALWAVTSLIAAGAALAWYLLGSFAALLGSAYGRTLLVKLGLVAALLGFAAFNKWRLTPALAGTEPVAASRAAGALRRSIGVESVLFLALALVTAVLTSVTILPDR